jgi:hypothetical protein
LVDRLTLERLRDRFADTVQADTGADWGAKYRPPMDDDPSTWKGALRFAFADCAYRYLCDVLDEFGDAGAYCPHCDDKPADGLFFPALCMSCWFDDLGYDEAVRESKWILQ